MTPQEITRDPNFLALAPDERIKVLRRVDPNFEALDPPARLKVAVSLGKAPAADAVPTSGAPAVPPAGGPAQHPHAAVGDALVGLLRGAGKDVARTAVGAGQLVHKGAEALGLAEPADAAFDAARANAAPTGIPEQAGGILSSLAQFALPAGALGKVVSSAPRLAAAPAALRTIVTEALSGGAVGATREGDLAAAPAAAAASGVGAGVGAGLGRVATALKGSAVATMLRGLLQGSGLNRKADVVRSAREIAPGLLEKGFHGSAEKLQKTAGGNLARLGDDLDAAIEALPDTTRVAAKPIIDTLEAAKDRYLQRFPSGKTAALDETAIGQIDQKIGVVKAFVAEYGPTVPAKELHRFKQKINSLINEGGTKDFFRGASDATELGSRRQLTDALREELAKTTPDINAINAAWSFWKKADTVATDLIRRGAGQKGGLTPQISAASVMGGLISGGTPITAAVAAGETAKGLSRIMGSTWWRTSSAQFKDTMAGLLASGKADQALKLATRASAGKLAEKAAADE